jgi:hypothetical protein
LEQRLSDDHVVTQNFLSTVQSAIRTSRALKKKIKDYFDKVEMTIENMENIRVVICSIDQFEIFDHIDKYEYLGKSLSNTYTYDYYIKWFQCFLTNSQIMNDTEQKKCKKLLEFWINCLKNKYTNLIHVLMAIDKLLTPFDKSDDWFCLYFIDRIIDLCFQQGISQNFLFNHPASFFI